MAESIVGRLNAGGTDRARLFFALWPDDRARDALANLARDAHAECGGRQTKPEKIHLTLVFLGDVGCDRIARLKALASAVRGSPFELELDTLGYWRHNRILWAGARRSPPALTDLVAALCAGLASEGAYEEDRPYVPHITLLRNARCAPGKRAACCVAWHVTEFALVESVRRGGADLYDTIGKWPL